MFSDKALQVHKGKFLPIIDYYLILVVNHLFCKCSTTGANETFVAKGALENVFSNGDRIKLNTFFFKVLV